jgi:DNA-binding response OmpR family regulator
MGMRVLVVDDDEKIRKIVAAYLKSGGYEVEGAKDGLAALELARKYRPDVILLDIMLPLLDGWRVCQEIRKGSEVPIIMLSACDEEADRVKGLDIGADDYVAKPFSPLELMARIKAVLRRTGAEADGNNKSATLQVGDLFLDRLSYSLKVKGEPVELTPTEYSIMETLMISPDQVFTRIQLIEKVQGASYEGYERTFDSHIKNLRKKIEVDPAKPHYIKTVFGVGYKLAGEENA